MDERGSKGQRRLATRRKKSKGGVGGNEKGYIRNKIMINKNGREEEKKK